MGLLTLLGLKKKKKTSIEKKIDSMYDGCLEYLDKNLPFDSFISISDLLRGVKETDGAVDIITGITFSFATAKIVTDTDNPYVSWYVQYDLDGTVVWEGEDLEASGLSKEDVESGEISIGIKNKVA